jgi:hypothetical protein
MGDEDQWRLEVGLVRKLVGNRLSADACQQHVDVGVLHTCFPVFITGESLTAARRDLATSEMLMMDSRLTPDG